MGEHVIRPRFYAIIFVALLILTGITVGMSRLELGLLHTWLGLAIAVVKATLVVLFFMHVYYSSRFTWVVAGSGLLFLGILLGLTLTDYYTRPANYEVETNLFQPPLPMPTQKVH